MATLNSVLKSVTKTTDTIGSSTSAQNKIAEVIISNISNNQIEYQLFITDNGANYPITPNTRLLVGEVHTKPMSTFISSSNTLGITISAKEVPAGNTAETKVDTITSIIEL
jgi:hypothetical protein